MSHCLDQGWTHCDLGWTHCDLCGIMIVGSILLLSFLLQRWSFAHDAGFSLCILLPLTMFHSGASQGPVWNMSVSCTHWYRVLWFGCKNTPCSLRYTLSPTHGTIFRHYEILEAWDLVGKWRPLWMDIGGSSLDWFWLHLAFRSTKKHGDSAIYQTTHLSICSSTHL